MILNNKYLGQPIELVDIAIGYREQLSLIWLYSFIMSCGLNGKTKLLIEKVSGKFP